MMTYIPVEFEVKQIFIIISDFNEAVNIHDGNTKPIGFALFVNVYSHI